MWMSHVTYERVISHMNESCHIRMSHVTYEWVTSQGRKIFAPDDSASFNHTYGYVMSHMNESRHIWMSHVKYVWVTSQGGNIFPPDDSASFHHKYEYVTSDVTYEWVIRRSYVTYEWVMSHMNESRQIWISHVTGREDSCARQQCLLPSHIWICHVTCRWVISHMNELYHIWMSHITNECVTSYMNESRHSLKSQVSFAKEPYEIDDILQKRPIILRSLLITANP